MLATFAAPLLQGICAYRAKRFARALDAVETTQRETLQRIVRACCGTNFAHEYGLRHDDNREAFRRKLPISDYASLAARIERQRRDPTTATITPGRVHCFEPTSGSSGATKAIPYNAALLGAFRSLFAIWVHDLLRHRLRLRSGRTFISVSPSFGAPRGLADDRDYLSGLQRTLVGHFLLTPSTRPAGSIEAFRRQLALDLLACTDLEIVSVWNPGYLLVLMDYVESRDPALMRELPAAQRRLLENNASPWAALWPRLQLVSCWTSAAAALPARQLALRLSQAHVQGKGLLATEAPVTLPLESAGGCVPLLDEVFLEFERDDGGVDLLHELEQDIDYGIVVTQPGGLLRYRLGDRVRVSGRYRDAPLLAFVGRADAVSDLVGEKLHEDFVDSALRTLFDDASFVTLVPVLPTQGRPFYACLTDAPSGTDTDLAARIDRTLQRALRYGEARALGQLDGVRIVAMSDMRRRVHDHYADCGMAIGDIKERPLITTLETARLLYTAIAADQFSSTG